MSTEEEYRKKSNPEPNQGPDRFRKETPSNPPPYERSPLNAPPGKIVYDPNKGGGRPPSKKSE